MQRVQLQSILQVPILRQSTTPVAAANEAETGTFPRVVREARIMLINYSKKKGMQIDQIITLFNSINDDSCSSFPA